MKKLVFKYAFFAVLAIAANLLTQHLVFARLAYPLSAAVVAGTGAGLVLKFWLDKQYIFYHPVKGVRECAQKFTGYSFTGIGTTLVFWGFEYLFHFLIPFHWAKYAGALLGLSLGYVLKYQLDKRLVFKHTEAICNR